MIKRRRLTATFYQLRQAISASMNDANDFGKSIHPGQIQALQHQRCILFQDQNENQTSYFGTLRPRRTAEAISRRFGPPSPPLLASPKAERQSLDQLLDCLSSLRHRRQLLENFVSRNLLGAGLTSLQFHHQHHLMALDDAP